MEQYGGGAIEVRDYDPRCTVRAEATPLGMITRWVSQRLSSGAHSRDPLAPPILRAAGLPSFHRQGAEGKHGSLRSM
jgi:hypothetical protein